MNLERKGMLYVIVSAILFGLMPLISRIALANGSNAMSVAFYRFIFGSIFLFLFSIKKGYRLSLNKKEFIQLFCLSIIYTLTVLLLYFSYNYIDTGLATTLHFTYPIVVIVIMAVVFKEKLAFKQMIATALCFFGMLMLYNPTGESGMFGIVLALFSGLTYAFYIVFLGKSELKKLESIVITAYMIFLSALEVLVVSVLTKQFVYDVTIEGWIAHFAMAFLTIVFAVVLFQKGIFMCGEMKASLLSTFEPLTGVFVGIIFMSETLLFKEVAGIVAILLSTILIVLPNRK